jgi:hypothetical protein
MLHAANAWPAPCDLEQALLDDVLGFALVPNDQVSGAKQVIDVSGDELVEVGHHSLNANWLPEGSRVAKSHDKRE